MKKICFVVSSPYTAIAFLKSIITALSKHFDVYLIANLNGHENKLLSKLEVKEIFHFNIVRKISLFKDLICTIKLINFLKKNKFDAIHSISPKAGIISMIAGFFSMTPKRIHTFTGQVWHAKKGLSKLILKNIDRLIVFCSTDILVDGKSQLNFLEKNNVISDKGLVLLNGSISGVNLNRFSLSNKVRNEKRNQLKIRKDEWVFMFLGRLNKDKGVIDLIKAFTLIDQKKYNCSLYLVGHDEENIKSNYCSFSPKIKFLPHEEKPEELLQACDTFCLPSHREGFGLSVIEASALKRPIVCSDTYGLKDTIIINKTGLTHPVGDVLNLNQKLKYCLTRKKNIRKMGENGRKFVEDRFNELNVIAEWERFYINSVN